MCSTDGAIAADFDVGPSCRDGLPSRAPRGWTPRETEHAAFSVHYSLEERRPFGARFSVLLFPHRDKERFVTTLERGATR